MFFFLTEFLKCVLPACGHSRLRAIFERCRSNAERDTQCICKDHSAEECGIPLGVCFQGVFYLVFGSTDVVNLENDGWGRHTLNVVYFGYGHAF